jgi:hypothetical protein
MDSSRLLSSMTVLRERLLRSLLRALRGERGGDLGDFSALRLIPLRTITPFFPTILDMVA